jgi:hypothetical protein
VTIYVPEIPEDFKDDSMVANDGPLMNQLTMAV